MRNKLIISKGRKILYTEKGILRMKCSRYGCNHQAKYQWRICADNELWKPICFECDIKLNGVVLKFMNDPQFSLKIKRYKARLV